MNGREGGRAKKKKTLVIIERATKNICEEKLQRENKFEEKKEIFRGKKKKNKREKMVKRKK